MSFKEDLYAYLQSFTQLSDIIGDKLYPHFVTTKLVTRPYVTYTRVSNVSTHHLVNPSDIIEDRYQFDQRTHGPHTRSMRCDRGSVRSGDDSQSFRSTNSKPRPH